MRYPKKWTYAGRTLRIRPFSAGAVFFLLGILRPKLKGWSQMQSIFGDLVYFKVGDLQEGVTQSARSARSGGTISKYNVSCISGLQKEAFSRIITCMSRKRSLIEKYPPSEPCACKICVSYCKRPGWWTVAEAASAIEAGYGGRMMLEMSPQRSFGVLSPAFKGCEVAFAANLYASRGCTFLSDDRCELFGSGFQPLECRFCHHERPGLGPRCHADIEKEWNTSSGRALVVKWSNLTNFWQNLAKSMPGQ